MGYVPCAQLCPTLCEPMDCSPPGSSVHGIFQARILEWAAISSSRGSSWPRDQTRVYCFAGRFLTTEPLGKMWCGIYYKSVEEGRGGLEEIWMKERKEDRERGGKGADASVLQTLLQSFSSSRPLLLASGFPCPFSPFSPLLLHIIQTGADQYTFLWSPRKGDVLKAYHHPPTPPHMHTLGLQVLLVLWKWSVWSPTSQSLHHRHPRLSRWKLKWMWATVCKYCLQPFKKKKKRLPLKVYHGGFPGGSVVKISPCQWRRHGFNPWTEKIPHATEKLSLCAIAIEPVL